MNTDVMSCGFKTATGKKINVNDECLKLAKEKMDTMESDPISISNFNKDFKTLHEKQIKEETADVEKNSNLFKGKPNTIINNLPSSAMNSKKMLDGKNFKKHQLVEKSKLNKYIEINNDSINKTEELPLSIKNLFKEDLTSKSNEDEEEEENFFTPSLSSSSSNKSEFKLDSNSLKLNDYLKENDFLFNPRRKNKISYLNVNDLELMEVSGNESDSCRHLVKPILELKVAEVK